MFLKISHTAVRMDSIEIQKALKANNRRFVQRLLIAVVLFVPIGLVGNHTIDFPYSQYMCWGLAITLLVMLNLIKTSFHCPSCHKSYWPPRSTACRSCGAVWSLTKDVFTPPNVIPIQRNSQVLEVKLAGLGKWKRYASKMKKGLMGLSLLLTLGLFGFYFGFSKEAFSLSAFIVPIFGGVSFYLFGWFFFLEVPEQIFRALYWKLHAKCPGCHKGFDTDSTVLPGAIVVRYSVPDYCTRCGAKLVVKMAA
ncbi:MAG: hypothetical protein FJ116_09985 [Deltaproteobacteria bacterium]|nr:hypothetical protein [Deltaproteobacteria bacterium]